MHKPIASCNVRAPLLIALVGVAGSGKSLVASRLESAHNFRVISIASLPKRFVGEAFKFTDEQLYGKSSSRSDPHPTARRADGAPLTARYALQTLADWARDCDPNVWIDSALQAAQGVDTVLPDVRFANEIAAIKRAGGILIRRKAPWAPTDMHNSERELLDMPDSEFAAVIPRMETVEDLHFIVDTLVSGWKSEAGQ